MPILFDGAIAAELVRYGFVLPEVIRTASAVREAGDMIKEIHTAFIRAGVHVIRANTADTTPRTLKRVGYEFRAQELTTRAVELAFDAVQSLDANVAVAGVLAPLEPGEDPSRTPSQDVVQAEHEGQARWLFEAGCDAIVVDTMPTIREAIAATVAAASTKLPVFTALHTTPENTLVSGEDLGKAARAVRDMGANVVLISGGSTLGDSERAGNILLQTGIPWGVLPNMPPRVLRERLLALAKRTFAKNGVVFGGTTNIGPEEMQAVAESLGFPSM
jgi:S-methylmethionine-dependent homocysteine/selenocysteine methylase